MTIHKCVFFHFGKNAWLQWGISDLFLEIPVIGNNNAFLQTIDWHLVFPGLLIDIWIIQRGFARLSTA